jgi:RNA polymerase sigma-70 factor (ECF subfamily)
VTTERAKPPAARAHRTGEESTLAETTTDRGGRGCRADVAPDAAAEERALLAALRAGDELAFQQLVRRHGGRLLAVARRLLRSEEEARDALQEAFVQAWRGLARFEGQARLSTWLHRIVVNAALMRLRSRRSRPEEPLEPLLPVFQEDGHTLERYVAWSGDPEQLAASGDVRRRVREAIDRLPASARTVLVLRDLEELDTAEVAARLGVTANAVKIRLHRARQALRELLDRELPELRPTTGARA